MTARTLAIKTIARSGEPGKRIKLDQSGMDKLPSSSSRGKYKSIISEVSRRRLQVRSKWSPHVAGGSLGGGGGGKRDLAMSAVAAFLDVATAEVCYMGVEGYVAAGEGMKGLEALGVGKRGRGLGNAVIRKVIREEEGRRERGEGGEEGEGSIANMGGGMDVVGLELKGGRATRVLENLKRVGMPSVSVSVGDGRVWRIPGGGEVGGVLVDAPCSSTGTGRRNPDVMTYEGGDLGELVELQYQLVRNAVGMVEVGGTVVYSTCSLLREENEGQVERFLRELPVELDPVGEVEVEGFEDCVGEGGIVRVWPGEDRDGFFVARFRKVEREGGGGGK
ncbi:hypothetical protein TrRE_jg11923 [Triparma retinervis]|uniref:SAM-dependent MTase RsmB/NOP-type domain-containing protein n=1 Tax=Triparma retinervis TaxID=2557542 RepID=A0A9W7E6Q8_9STRA|nr:hypothetical protein TrRE_jg11923 [Triparma retinervis]